MGKTLGCIPSIGIKERRYSTTSTGLITFILIRHRFGNIVIKPKLCKLKRRSSISNQTCNMRSLKLTNLSTILGLWDCTSMSLARFLKGHSSLDISSNFLICLCLRCHKRDGLFGQFSRQTYNAIQITNQVIPWVNCDTLLVSLQFHGDVDLDKHRSALKLTQPIVRCDLPHPLSPLHKAMRFQRHEKTPITISILPTSEDIDLRTGNPNPRCSCRSLTRPSTIVPTAPDAWARLLIRPP